MSPFNALFAAFARPFRAHSEAGSSSRRASSRRQRAAAARLGACEQLEPKQVMAANLLAAIADQQLTSSAPVTINLANHFDETAITGTVVKFATNAPLANPDFYVEMFDELGAGRTRTTPATVSNFLSYVNDPDALDNYDNTIIHRAVPGFVIQGGGYTAPNVAADLAGSDPIRVPQKPTVVNEPGNLNTAGTIAMAKLGGLPNSATNQFFFNLGNNSDLDTQNGGFTVFGRVLGSGMTVINTMASALTYNATTYYGNEAFNDFPLWNVNADNIVQPNDFVKFTQVSVVPETALMSFTVSSANTAKLTAAIVNGQLVLTPTAGQTGAVNVTVTGRSALDNSTTSDTFVVELGSTKPSEPTNVAGVAGVAGNRQVGLTWTAPRANGGPAITDYVIQYSSNNGTSWTTFNDGPSTSTSATVTGLTNGTPYVFRVSAVNAAGTGPASTNSAAVTPRTVAGAPTTVAATAGNGQVSLAWTAPASNGGATITDYVIQHSTDKGRSWTTYIDGESAASSATVAGLTNGVSYHFRVLAVNDAGAGAWSRSSVVVMVGSTAPTETIDAQGGKLLQKNPAGQLFVDGLPIRRSGIQVREGAFQSVEFLQAEAIAGVNRLLFRDRTSGAYKVWVFDTTWTRNIAVQGVPSLVTAASDFLAFEAGFNLDFNNDGRIGSIVVESNGTRVLERHSTGLVVDGKSIMRGGRQVTPQGYPAVDFIAAEAIDGINRLLFREKSSGLSKIWSFDTNWVYQRVDPAPAPSDSIFRRYEISFSADLNNDGWISAETVGVQTLQRDAAGRLFVDGSAVMRAGRQVAIAGFPAVDFLGAELVAGTNRLLFREKSTGAYKTWRFDSSWVYQGVDAIPADASSRNLLEAAFDTDLDLDSDIGL